MSPTCSLSLIGKAPVSKTGRCGFESQQIVPSSYMRNRVVEKSTEAYSSQMRLVFAERPNEFVGEVQHVDNKRIPINYHKRNTPMSYGRHAYHVAKKVDIFCEIDGIGRHSGFKIPW